MAVTGRRERPAVQLRVALVRAKLEGLSFLEAWPRARDGELCDDYASARTDDGRAWPELTTPTLDGTPPGMRVSPDGEKRCAGCRYLAQDGGHCARFDVLVYSGILWPHRTEERTDWKYGVDASREEWHAAYEQVPTKTGDLFAMLKERGIDADAIAGLPSGTLAA